MATLTGPPMNPPTPPLMAKSASQMTPTELQRNIEVLYEYLNNLVDYFYEYNPTVESP